MYWSVLDEKRITLLKKILKNIPLAESYLAGGTALALMLGHRVSYDFDWFAPVSFDPEDVSRTLSHAGKIVITETTRGSFHGFVDGIQVTWLFYPNPLLFDKVMVKELPNFYLSSLPDIGLMKWAAISHRGARRDFIDLYYICRQGYELKKLFLLLDKKFPGAEINHYHMVKSLSYFFDAEREAHPQMIKEVSWKTVKAFFIEEQKKLLTKLL